MMPLISELPPTRARAFESAFWAAAGSLGRYALAGITTLILTRLLEPRDFGLIAITVAAEELIAHIAPVGFHDAIIQRQHLSRADLDAAFWSIMGTSGGLALLVILLAPMVADIFHEPRLLALLIAVTLAALLRAVSMVPRALLARDLDFRTPTLARLVGMVMGGLCAIGLAAGGAGVWSLVAQTVILNLVATILVWRAVAWNPSRRIVRNALPPLWNFAASISLSTLLIYVVTNADDQMVGYHLGQESLGFYALAYSFMAWPVRDVLGGVSVVLYPIFSRFQDEADRLQAVYLESLQLATAFAFPTLALITITASLLVPTLLGARWIPITLTVQILALSGLRESTMMLNGAVYRAVGRPQIQILLMTCNVACFLPAFVVGVDFGIEGVAFFYLLTGLLLYPVALWLVLSVAHISLRAWLAALLPITAATVLMSAAAVISLHLLYDVFQADELVSLVITGICSGAVYALVLYILTPLGVKRTVLTALQYIHRYTSE